MEKVKYWFCNDGAPISEKDAPVDYSKIKQNILLNLYYAEIMKIKETSVDVLSFIGTQLWYECCTNEIVYAYTHVRIPEYEIMRIMAKIYSEKLISTRTENDLCIVELTETGRKKCLEYLT